MRNKQEHIFSLIKSLDKAEKRNLNLYLSKYNLKKKNHALTLLNAINKMDIYDEATLKKELTNKSLLKNFNYEKFRLQQLILDFLTEFHLNKGIKLQIQSLLKQVNILLQKNLIDLAWKIMKKGIRLSEEIQDYQQLYRFLNLKITYAHLFLFEGEDINQLIDALNDCMKKLNNEHESHIIYRKITQQYFELETDNLSNEAKNKKFAWFKETPFFDNDELCLTCNGEKFIYQAKHLYYTCIKDFDKALDYNQKTLDVFEENPFFLKQFYTTYFGIYFNHIATLIDLKKFSDAEKALEKLDAFPLEYEDLLKEPSRIKSNFYLFSYFYRLKLYQGKSEYQKGYELLYSRYEEIKEYFFNYNEYKKIEFLYFDIAFCFALGKYKEVVDKYPKFENIVDFKAYSSICIYSKLLVLISNYELGNHRQLESLFNALYYYCRSLDINNKVLKFELKVLRKAINTLDKRNLSTYCQSLNNTFQAIHNNFAYEDLFPLWFESILLKKSIKEVGELKREMLNPKNLVKSN